MSLQAETAVPERPEVSDPNDDPRVLELVKDYQAQWELGHRPDRSDYLSRYPELAEVLPAYLDGIDLLHRGTRALSGRGRLDTGLCTGDRLGEYELIREIGRGGMGVVYEARQSSLNRRVAVKVLPAAFAADRARLQRFTVEAQAAAAVAHPHIVPVYAIGEDLGVNYYVMGLVEGDSLDALAVGASRLRVNGDPVVKSGACAELLVLSQTDRAAFHRLIAQLGSQIALALDHAHQCGVIHRDVKPANLLLDRDGHIWVTDFGLAQFADGPSVTRSGATIGTLRYMSPEQAAGDRRRLDHRTDVYSLAVTLYELITGNPAFPASEPAVLARQIANDDPPLPRSVDPAVHRDLETVLLKALQKDPRDRYATAAEFADDLERFIAGRPVHARRPSAWDRAKRWVGKHPTPVAAAFVSLVVIVVATSVAAALVAAEQGETQRAYQESERAFREADEAHRAAKALAKAERARADEAERRFRRAKELGDLILRISEEEIGSDSPFQGPRRRLLLAALETYRELLSAGNDPVVRVELDRVLNHVQGLLADQDLRREAEGAFLLASADVRAELDLSSDQTKRVEKLLARPQPGGGGPPGKGPGGGPGRPDRPGDRELWRPSQEARIELIKLLNANQRHRLRQIFVQYRGPLAFNEPDVIDALDLSHSQRQQIKLIQSDGFAGFGGFTRPGGGFGFGGAFGPGSPFKEPRTSPDASARVTERILDTLSAEQRDIWRSLVGKAFNPVR